MHHYFICLDRQTTVSWTPPEVEPAVLQRRPDCDYFGQVLAALHPQLPPEPSLTVYLTWDLSHLPRYGKQVVAIVLGDEGARVPRYVHRVGIIFKCYGSLPRLTATSLPASPRLFFLSVLQYLRSYALGFPGLCNLGLQTLKSIVRLSPSTSAAPSAVAPIYPLPLGYLRQLDLPIKPIADRTNDAYFSGSIAQQQTYAKGSLKQLLGQPKTLARQQMQQSIERIRQTHPDWMLHLQTTPDFQSSLQTSVAAYSENMMNTKICLVPRGASVETFRYFEALRYGCVVVAEAQPPFWFYQNSPAIHLTSWRQLEPVLTQLLQDPVQLQQKHQASLDWWQQVCSETAVAAYMATRIRAVLAEAAIDPALPPIGLPD